MSKRYKPKKGAFFTWSPELAYAVGLIVTDGCLSSDRRHIIFTSQDLEQIENFKKILKINNKIGITRNKLSYAHRVQFGNVQMYDWFTNIGLTPNKSLTLGKIKLPDEYFIDFLRGHLDGDGSITTYTDFYNTKKKAKYVYQRIFVRFISASDPHASWLHKSITRILNVKGAFHSTKKIEGKNQIHIIKFGKKESLNLLSQIYYSDKLSCLSRKKNVYIEFIKTQIK